MALIRFMASPIGRGVRVGLGVALMALGFAVIGGTAGVIIGVVGILPLALGALDICLLAPAFGCALHGAPR